MLGNYITVDGVSSRTLGLFCKQLPMWPVAVPSYNAITVGGRLDNIYQNANHYQDIQVDVEAVFIGFDMDPIIRYFSNGAKLWFSNIPDRYAVIRQLVAIDQKRVGNGALELKITLKCSPFKYKMENNPIVITSSPDYFQTTGTIYSEPLIIAKNCTDGFTLTLNGTQITTAGLTDDIYIDVQRRVVYTIDGNFMNVVQNDKVSGNIWDLLLVPSDIQYNTISFSGAAEIDIIANERWL